MSNVIGLKFKPDKRGISKRIVMRDGKPTLTFDFDSSWEEIPGPNREGRDERGRFIKKERADENK